MNQPKLKPVKAWAVYCSEIGFVRAFHEKIKAEAHNKRFLNEEYGLCRHKIIPVLITPLTPKKKQK